MWGVEICKIYSKIIKKYHHCVKFTYPLSFQTRIPKVDQHTGGKWLIHGTKHRKDNQLQSLELSCRISYLIGSYCRGWNLAAWRRQNIPLSLPEKRLCPISPDSQLREQNIRLQWDKYHKVSNYYTNPYIHHTVLYVLLFVCINHSPQYVRHCPAHISQQETYGHEEIICWSLL